jgi:hypothetical protein
MQAREVASVTDEEWNRRIARTVTKQMAYQEAIARLRGLPDGVDPIIVHSHIADCLPDDHPLARVTLWCMRCNEMLHCEINECMQTWLETLDGYYCVACYPLRDVMTLDDSDP